MSSHPPLTLSPPLPPSFLTPFPPPSDSASSSLSTLSSLLFLFSSTPTDSKFLSSLHRVLPSLFSYFLHEDEQVREEMKKVIQGCISRSKTVGMESHRGVVIWPIRELSSLVRYNRGNIQIVTYGLILIEMEVERISKMNANNQNIYPYDPYLILLEVVIPLLSLLSDVGKVFQESILYIFLVVIKEVKGKNYRNEIMEIGGKEKDNNKNNNNNPIESKTAKSISTLPTTITDITTFAPPPSITTIMAEEEILYQKKLKQFFPFAYDPKNKDILMKYIIDFMMYQPVSINVKDKDKDKDSSPPLPSGFSPDRLTFLLHHTKLLSLPLSLLHSYQHSLLLFLSSHPSLFNDHDIVLPAMIGEYGGGEDSRREGERMMKKHKKIDYENKDFISLLFHYYLINVTDPPRSHCPIQLKMRILVHLARSNMAITTYSSHALKVIFDSLFYGTNNFTATTTKNNNSVPSSSMSSLLGVGLPSPSPVVPPNPMHSIINIKLALNGMGFFSHFVKNGKEEIFQNDKVGKVLLEGILKFYNNCKDKEMEKGGRGDENQMSDGDGNDNDNDVEMKDLPSSSSPSFTTFSSVASRSTPSLSSSSSPSSTPSAPYQLSLLRSTIYTLLGQLSLRIPTLFNQSTALLRLFFDALRAEKTDSTLQAVHEGMSNVRNTYFTISDKDKKYQIQQEIRSLCFSLISSSDKRIRLHSLICINRLFPFHDVEGRMICCLYVGDEAVEVRDEARKGLEEYRGKEGKSSSISSGSGLSTLNDLSPIPWPSFPMFIHHMSASLSLSPSLSLPSSPLMDSRVFSHLLSFCWECLDHTSSSLHMTSPEYIASLVSSSVDNESNVTSLTTFLLLIEKGVEHPLSEIQVLSSSYLYKYVRLHPTFFTPLYCKINQSNQHNDIIAPITHTSKLDWLRKYLLGSTTHTRSNLSLLLSSLCETLPYSTLLPLLKEFYHICHFSLSTISSFRSTAAADDSIHGALLGMGVVVAEIHKRVNNPWGMESNNNGMSEDDVSLYDTKFLEECCNEIVIRLDNNTWQREPSIAAAAAISIGRIGLAGPLPLPDTIEENEKSSSSPATPSTSTVVDTKSNPPLPPTERFTKMSAILRLISLTKGTERKGERLVEESITALANIVRGDKENITFIRPILSGLFSLIDIKHEEIHFSIGETLAAIGDITTTYENSKISHMEMKGKEEGKEKVVASSSSSVGSDMDYIDRPSLSSSSPSLILSPHANPMEEILHFTTTKLLNGNQIQRIASCLWLLCLIKYSSINIILQRMIPTIQSTLCVTLVDPHTFLQECAAKGLAILYDSCKDERVKEKMIGGLLRVFQVGQGRGGRGRAVVESNNNNSTSGSNTNSIISGSEGGNDNDAIVSSSSGLTLVSSSSPLLLDDERGEFSTYQELCQVANDIGQPQLLYKFLDLATHHTIWSSKLGSSFSVNNSILKSSATLSPHLHVIIPKLYRYQYDNNAKIKLSMKLMWQSLVDDPRKTITEHFNPIMKDLINHSMSKSSRVRLSVVGGLTDLLMSRSFEEVGQWIENIYEILYNSLDDVQEEVRVAAMTLYTAVSALTSRLCDIRYTSPSSSTLSMNVIIPILLTKGIPSRVKEISSISMTILLTLIKNGGSSLRSHIPSLLLTLLEALGSNENPLFSYLQQNTQQYQLTEEQLELHRLSISKSSPIYDALSYCIPLIDQSNIVSVIQTISDIMKGGLGLSTLTSCAKLLITLCNHPVLSVSMKEYSGSILTILYNGIFDNSISIRRIYCQAIGYLCRISKPKKIIQLLHSLIKMYTDNRHRVQISTVFHFMVTIGGESLKDYYTDMIPFIIFATHDTEKEISKVFTTVLDEITSSSDNANEVYKGEIVTFCLSQYQNPHWIMREISYKTLSTLLTTIEDRINDRNIRGESYSSLLLIPTLSSLSGRLFNGKQHILPLLTLLSINSISHISFDQLYFINLSLLNECSRNKVEYRMVGIQSYSKLMSKCKNYIHQKELAMTNIHMGEKETSWGRLKGIVIPIVEKAIEMVSGKGISGKEKAKENEDVIMGTEREKENLKQKDDDEEEEEKETQNGKEKDTEKKDEVVKMEDIAENSNENSSTPSASFDSLSPSHSPSPSSSSSPSSPPQFSFFSLPIPLPIPPPPSTIDDTLLMACFSSLSSSYPNCMDSFTPSSSPSSPSLLSFLQQKDFPLLFSLFSHSLTRGGFSFPVKVSILQSLSTIISHTPLSLINSIGINKLYETLERILMEKTGQVRVEGVKVWIRVLNREEKERGDGISINTDIHSSSALFNVSEENRLVFSRLSSLFVSLSQDKDGDVLSSLETAKILMKKIHIK